MIRLISTPMDEAHALYRAWLRAKLYSFESSHVGHDTTQLSRDHSHERQSS
jgi:hypothetical protein